MDTTTLPGVGLDAEQQEFLRLFEAKYGRSRATRLRRTMYAPRVMPGSKRTTGCWTRRCSKDCRGYTYFRVAGKSRTFHRLVKELYTGPLAPTIEVDHQCEVKECFNPAHLSPVAKAVHPFLGSTSIIRHNVEKTNCSKCGSPLVATNKKGHRGCAQCRRTSAKERYNQFKQDPEEIARAKAYRDTHREERKEKGKEYYKKNRDRIRSWVRTYQEKNREKISAKRKAHYDAHRDEELARHRVWYADNREGVNARRRARRVAHGDEIRAREREQYRRDGSKRRAAQRAYTARRRDEINARQKVYYQRNRAKRLAAAKEYQATHSDERKAYQRAYRAAHREAIKANGDAWHCAHPEKRLGYQRVYHAANRERLNAKARARYAAKKAAKAAQSGHRRGVDTRSVV